tara:strand:+ start:441 stop:1838 length:1398 start_codon:yes stop_codon:yes gene_type:complete
MSDNNEQVQTLNPSDGRLYKTYSLQTKEQAEQLIEKAHEAFLQWRDSTFERRAEIIQQIGQELTKDKEELSKMMALQMGKPVSQGRKEVDLCAAICQYTAEHGPDELMSESREAMGGMGIVSYEPMGVILGMQPWNFPCYQAIRYSIACFMAGNATVFKHATICWETAQKLQDIFERAGLPKYVFTPIFVNNETVDQLIAHPKITGVTFTGSATAGRIIGEQAGKHLKKSVLELGGSDPYLILDKENLKETVKICVQGRINNAGQTCVAAKRFIVLASIYEDFKAEFVRAMKQVTYGDPIKDEADMGPLSNQELQETLHQQVQDSINKGAKCHCGGELPEGPGYFYPATVLTDVKSGMPAYDEELFGPVAVLFKAKDIDDAVRLANDHRYGLGGGVFCADDERALNVAHRINTGMVNINGYNLAQPNMPFGGVKDSGFGREHGGFGLKEFVNVKSIVISNDADKN